MCLSHIAFYFSLFILVEANKTPASSEHSQSSSSAEGGWESLAPAFHGGTLTYSYTSGSQDVLFPCCLCGGVSPQGCSTCPHLWHSQPNHGIRKSIIGTLQCLPGLCQRCQGPCLSLLTWVFMTPDSTDFMRLGHLSFPCRNAVFEGAVCVCCPSSFSPATVPLS